MKDFIDNSTIILKHPDDVLERFGNVEMTFGGCIRYDEGDDHVDSDEYDEPDEHDEYVYYSLCSDKSIITAIVVDPEMHEISRMLCYGKYIPLDAIPYRELRHRSSDGRQMLAYYSPLVVPMPMPVNDPSKHLPLDEFLERYGEVLVSFKTIQNGETIVYSGGSGFNIITCYLRIWDLNTLLRLGSRVELKSLDFYSAECKNINSDKAIHFTIS